MRRHFHNLFIPHRDNNHRAKIIHHSSLSKLIILLLLFQFSLSSFAHLKPGVLGYASNVTAEQVAALTNAQREEKGQQPLKLNAALSESARRKAAHMFTNNYWAHNAPDGTSPWYFFKNVGYNYIYAGENLARDFGDSTSVIQAWMDSPTHRDNILSSRYTEIGIGVVNGILNGQETTLVVQHFARPAAAPAAVPTQAARTNSPPVTQPVAGTNEQKAPSVAYQEPTEQVPITPMNEKEENSEVLKSVPEIVTKTAADNQMPVVSTFDLTKSVNLALSAIIVAVLLLDGFLIWHRGTVRRSGKSFAHLSLFAIVALIIILSGQGRIQ